MRLETEVTLLRSSQFALIVPLEWVGFAVWAEPAVLPTTTLLACGPMGAPFSEEPDGSELSVRAASA